MSRPKSPPDDPDPALQRSNLLADISVAIHTGAMTRVAAAHALLAAIDPTTLSSELVISVLRAEDAYRESSAMRTLMSVADRTLFFTRIYETAGLLDFAELLDVVAARKSARQRLD